MTQASWPPESQWFIVCTRAVPGVKPAGTVYGVHPVPGGRGSPPVSRHTWDISRTTDTADGQIIDSSPGTTPGSVCAQYGIAHRRYNTLLRHSVVPAWAGSEGGRCAGRRRSNRCHVLRDLDWSPARMQALKASAWGWPQWPTVSQHSTHSGARHHQQGAAQAAITATPQPPQALTAHRRRGRRHGRRGGRRSD